MDQNSFITLTAIVILFAIGSWVFTQSSDEGRIRRNLESRGDEVISIETPNLAGALLQDDAVRTYLVHFRDRSGNEHQAHCTTSGRIGVLLKDDLIVDRVSPSAEEQVICLEEENRLLREALELQARRRSDNESTRFRA